MYDEVRNWNKVNIVKYIEIYIKVPFNKIIENDKNKLFSKALKKEEKNVVGVDIKIEEPKKPDIIIENDMKSSIANISKYLINKIDSIKVNQTINGK